MQVQHNWYANCAKCGKVQLKREMQVLFTAESRYLAPRVLCHLCPSCYAAMLDELEITEK